MLSIYSFTILSLCSISDRKYTSKVYILLCRSYILMDCSDFILAQPSTHSLLRCCDRAKYWTSAAVLFIFCECAYTHARYVFYYVVATYWWIVLILFLRSQLRIHYWDVVIERILYELLPMQQIMRGRARYVFYYVVATYWWIVLILLLRS